MMTCRGEALIERLTATHREELHRIAPELRSILRLLKKEAL